MNQIRVIFFAIIILTSFSELISKPLITPDTIFINPANYNKNIDDVNPKSIFQIRVNNKTGVEIISMTTDFDFVNPNENDKTYINTLPNLFNGKNGNNVLEDKSIINVKAIVVFNNPDLERYIGQMFINYKTIEYGFEVDTVHIVAQKVDADIYTKKDILIRETCDYNNKDENLTFYSSLLKGNNDKLTLKDINIRSDLDYTIKGYLHKLYDYNAEPMPTIEFPYEFVENYFTIEFNILDSKKESGFVYVDYETDKGVFYDTITIAYTKKLGITAKTFYQNLKSIEYKKVESEYNAIRLCSKDGYRIKSIQYDGEFDETEIELEEYYKVGDIIEGNYAELSKFTITPQKLPFVRSGNFNYLLENVNTGNLISVDFPFNLEIEFLTDITDYKDKETYIYPNPAVDLLYINPELNVFEVNILNSVGKSILNVTNKHNINISNLEKGFYIVLISYDNKIIYEKFIKE